MGVAGATLIFYLVNQFLCGKSDPQAQSAPQQVAAAAQPAPQPAKDEKSTTAPRKRGSPQRSDFSAWSRDPFAESFRLAQGDTTESDSSDFVLRGLIWKGNQAHVLIGDDILKEGDQIGDLKILDIDKNRVVCKKRGKIVTLILRDDHD